jgi:hypothetical protein
VCKQAANHKTFLKRASGCFQNVGKNVLTPEGSTLKTDVQVRVWQLWFKKKQSRSYLNHLVLLPSHSRHMLQQSDSLPMKFLKTVYIVEAAQFTIYNAEKFRTQIYICGMFRSGYLPTARAEKRKITFSLQPSTQCSSSPISGKLEI